MTTSTFTFTVDRQNLRVVRWVETQVEALPAGSVRLRIDLFALTSNNITYAVFGDSLDYWRFYPTGDAHTGCIPVWGFAEVTESRCDGVAVGERLYGFYPMADQVVLQPVHVDWAGFADGVAHRRDLHAVYNQYLRCGSDPAHDRQREAEQALLRPLFTTAFLIDDWLADNAFFGARRVLIASASSKTAYSTAFQLARRNSTAAAAVRITGLTSRANLAFTEGLGCYDEVLSYDLMSRLDASEPTVYVDMSGSAPVRSAVHAHFKTMLMHSCSVGGTHWNELGSGEGLSGPRPTLFFAPAQGKKRVADWGLAGFKQRLGVAWNEFIVHVADPRHPWLHVQRGEGRSAVDGAYCGLLDGSSRPEVGHVLRAW